jgi:hypothetical protein
VRRLGEVLALAAAAGCGVLVSRSGLLPPGDPFAGTLAVLPVVVVALVLIGRRGRRWGRPWAPWAEALALAGLVLAVLARSRLGVAVADEALAAGLVGLLAAHLVRRLLGLRPLLGRRLPACPPAAFFALPFVVYLALLPWSTFHRPPDGDEPWYLLLTHSLAYDGDAELTNNYAAGDWRSFIDRPLEPQPGDPSGPEGQIYSRHNALLPLVLAPAYRLFGKLGALTTMALLTAALAWVTLRLGRHYAPERPGEVLAAYALVAFAPPMLLYSYQLWVEVPAALLSMAALDACLTLEARRREGAAGWGRAALATWLVLAAALVLLPLLKIRFMLLALPLAALAWWHSGRPWKPALVLGGLLALVGAGILIHNQLLYDNPLKIHTWQEVEVYQYSVREYLSGFFGLFFDAGFGLFACAPLWLLLLPAFALLLLRRHPLVGDLAVFVLPYLVIVAPRREWYGGWSPPFRYALIALPLLGLGLVPLLAGRRRGAARALLAALGALTLVLTLLWVAVPGWTYNFADGRTYLLDHLSRDLGADVARLFPSFVRPRTATWIWPAAAALLVPLLWWLPGRRPRRAALWGVAALLLAAAAVPVAAHRLPTRIVELEDPQVVKHGGHLYPDPWVIERPRYRGGWVLREGESLAAPVVAGGRRLRLRLDAEFIRNRPGPRRLALEVRAGGKLLATLVLDAPRQWQRLDAGEIDWPAGEDLVLRLPPGHHPGPPSGAILDRLDLQWR